MALNNIVARFLDGRVLKGTSLNVDPEKPALHVRTPDGAVEVKLAELKALFFVKDLGGDPAHQEAIAATPGDVRLVGGKAIAVEFRDRETIVGVTNRFPPIKDYFFVTPIDPRSNNIRILVNRAATRSIRETSARVP